MTRRLWITVGGYGLLITICVLGAFALAFVWLNEEQGSELLAKKAVTISFLTLAFAQLWHVFNMRDQGSGLFRNDITTNPFAWGAIALCSGLLLGAVYLPVLSDVLKLVHPGLKGWTLVVVMSLLPMIVGQFQKAFARKV